MFRYYLKCCHKLKIIIIENIVVLNWSVRTQKWVTGQQKFVKNKSPQQTFTHKFLFNVEKLLFFSFSWESKAGYSSIIRKLLKISELYLLFSHRIKEAEKNDMKPLCSNALLSMFVPTLYLSYFI